MTEDFNEFEERATLTQRRQMGGAAKLNRSKLQPTPPVGAADEPEGKNGRIVIWVVAVITVAAAAYFGIKNYMQNDAGTDNTDIDITAGPTEEPVQTLEEQIIGAEVLPAEQAENRKDRSSFTSVSQNVGVASDTEYVIDDITVNKYTSFTRMSIAFIAEPNETGTEAQYPFPAISAVYDATAMTISITINQVASNVSAFTGDEELTVNSASIATISHDVNVPVDQEKYVIHMKTPVGYIMHVNEALGTVYIDVADDNTKVQEPTTIVVTTPVVSTTTSITKTPIVTTPIATSPATTPIVVSDSSTDFSLGAQQIMSELATNTFTLLDGYKCGDNYFSTATQVRYSGMFTFEKTFDKDFYPNVSAELTGTTLVVQIENYSTKTKSLQTIDLNAKCNPTANTKTLRASVANNVLKYEFDMTAAKEYRIAFNMDKKVMQVQIKN